MPRRRPYLLLPLSLYLTSLFTRASILIHRKNRRPRNGLRATRFDLCTAFLPRPYATLSIPCSHLRRNRHHSRWRSYQFDSFKIGGPAHTRGVPSQGSRGPRCPVPRRLATTAGPPGRGSVRRSFMICPSLSLAPWHEFAKSASLREHVCQWLSVCLSGSICPRPVCLSLAVPAAYLSVRLR